MEDYYNNYRSWDAKIGDLPENPGEEDETEDGASDTAAEDETEDGF